MLEESVVDSQPKDVEARARPPANNVTELDQRLREYAKHRAALDAAEAFDLVRAESLRLHAFYGCATFFEYLERRLGYAPHTARERMRVSRALVTLPHTATELARGAVSFSIARELTRVATPDTEQEWLAKVANKNVRQVEDMVAGHKLGDRPDDPVDPDLRMRRLGLDVAPQGYALWRQARSVLAGLRGAEISDADLLETLCRAFIQPGSGADGPAHLIAYKQCEQCKRVTQNGAGRAIDVAPAVFERAACDARVLGSLDAESPERATTTVTPRLREQVFARDGFRCCVPGCRSARNLEVHHIEPQCLGGSHALWNLMLLCGGHHDAHHDGLLIITGRAPYDLGFRWKHGQPMPPGLSPAERERFIATRIEEILEVKAPANEEVPPGKVEQEEEEEEDRRHTCVGSH